MNNLSKSKLDGKISMFVGMDLHKNYLQIAVMNDKGKVLENSGPSMFLYSWQVVFQWPRFIDIIENRRQIGMRIIYL